MPYYPNPNISGIISASSIGDGYGITLRWATAYPKIKTNKIAYNIYVSQIDDYTIPENLFKNPPSFVSITGITSATVIGLIPGELYFFGVRAIEYNPDLVNLNILPNNGSLKFYPTSLLAADISATDLVIPLVDTEFFPPSGVVQIGAELVAYTSISSNNLNVDGGADGYIYVSNTSLIDSNKGDGYINSIVLSNFTVAQNWIIKCISADGYDGYGNLLPTQFIAIGSITGTIVDKYENPIVWYADGTNPRDPNNADGYYNIALLPISFNITQGTTRFLIGGGFNIKVSNFLGVNGGRGYNDTLITFHNTDGYDGYTTWSPLVSIFVGGEEQNTKNFECQNRFEYPNYSATATDGYHQRTKDILTTDLSGSDAFNETLPPYDYSSYHQTDPVALLTGDCVGSYIGGEQYCMDGYSGVGRVIRGMSVQEQNNQRQEILLSLTGEPVALFHKRRTGITCNCYTPASEYPDDRCPNCFAPGTLVRAESGWKPIENIKIGEKVLSSDGKYHKVLRTFENKYDGDMYSILPSIGTNPILTTPEHPFLMLNSTHKINSRKCGPKCNAFIKNGDGTIRGENIRYTKYNSWQARLCINSVYHNIGSFDTKEEAQIAYDQFKSEHLRPQHSLNWSYAENITKDSWLVAKWPEEIYDIEEINIPDEFLKHTHLGMQRNGSKSFIVDEEFLWIIGLYLAEGCNGKRSINFALHKKETIFAERVVTFFNKYGFNTTIHSHLGNGIVVDVYSTTLAQWFPKWLGKHCNNKRIPEELMKLPNNKVWAIINGINDGDGCKTTDDAEIIQTSEILALQLVELLHRVGEQPLVRPANSHILTAKGNVRKQAYCVSYTQNKNKQNTNRRGRWSFDDQLLSSIKKINKIKYSGMVYNLEVEDTHTYVVQGIITHNCNGSGFVIGWEQFFNPRRSDGRILVRFSPADDDLKTTDGGLESELITDCWTMTMPTIKDRDFIIRFDEDDNEEFRYEVLSVNRNKLLDRLQGGQKFKVQRVRKTDPIYTVRSFRNTSLFPSSINTGIGSVPGLIVPHTHTITRNETASTNWSQITSVSQGHSHSVVVIGGVLTVLEALGHSHQIIL